MTDKIITLTSTTGQQPSIDPFIFIPASKHNAIRATDPHPVYKFFTVAHEGTANPGVSKTESVHLKVTSTNISQIYAAISEGVPCFTGTHYPEIGTTRPQVGRVIQKIMQATDTGNRVDVIVYFNTESKSVADSFDSCSMEFMITATGKLENGEYEVKKVEGILLFNTKEFKPAFEKAKDLQTLTFTMQVPQPQPGIDIPVTMNTTANTDTIVIRLDEIKAALNTISTMLNSAKATATATATATDDKSKETKVEIEKTPIAATVNAVDDKKTTEKVSNATTFSYFESALTAKKA